MHAMNHGKATSGDVFHGGKFAFSSRRDEPVQFPVNFFFPARARLTLPPRKIARKIPGSIQGATKIGQGF